MARIRTIKPEFFTSEDIVSLSPLARLLYIAIWCEADKEGRLAWKPMTFKLRYFPGDACDIQALCKEIVDTGLVTLYGDGFAVVPTFKTHQHINPRESDSKLPDPCQLPARNDPVNDASARVPDASPRVSDAQGGREGKGKEGNKDSVPSGTDGAAVASLAEMTKAELWSTGKSLLAEQGMPERQCGSFVGKLVKDYGDEIVIEAVRSTCVARPADAAEYLKALCLRAAGQRRPAASTTTQDRRAATLAGLTNTGENHADRDGRTIDVEAHVVG